MRAYVYIVKNKAFPGLLKIGLAKNVPSRIASLSNPSVPFKFELIEVFCLKMPHGAKEGPMNCFDVSG